MSHEPVVPDPRIIFIGEWCMRILKIKQDKWAKAITSEEARTAVNDFFEKRNVRRLLVFLAGPGNVMIQLNFPPILRGRAVYFMKKESKPLPTENFRTKLIIGDISPNLFDHMTKFMEQVVAPTLSNEDNSNKWSSVVTLDVSKHVSEIQGFITMVAGEMKGKTFLALPTGIERINAAEKIAREKHEVQDSELLHAIEGTIIRWVHQVAELLQKDSASEMLKQKNPGPRVEMNFWKTRYDNLVNIKEQFEGTTLQSMELLLKISNSSYYPALIKLYDTVSTALEEAMDITMHLRTLQEYVDYMDSAEFPECLPKLKLLLFCTCLIWANSVHYCKPSRIVILLQEINNMVIENARVFVDAATLFQAEIPDSMDKIEKSLKIINAYKEVFMEFESKVPTFFRDRPPKLWEFSISLVFDRFDSFVERLYMIKDMFDIATEMIKLERVDMGGIKGKDLSTQTFQVYTEFMEIYNTFANKTYDSLDVDETVFLKDVGDFQYRVRDFDLRLSAIMLIAFDDCSGLEAIFKFFDMVGTLLERPIIKADFAKNYIKIVQLLDEEISNVKKIYIERMKLVEKNVELPVHIYMPPVAGSIKWAQELRHRIVRPMTAFRGLEHPITKGEEVHLVYKNYDEVKSLLDGYESSTYNKWTKQVDEVCQMNMNQPVLLRRNDRIHVNFDNKLIAVLREVKYLNFFGYTNMPVNAEKLYAQREFFRNYVYRLEQLASGYNMVVGDCLPSELALVAEKLEAIEEQLEIGLGEMTWDNEGLQEYVEETGGLVGDLEDRVMKAKSNLEQINNLIESWGSSPLHCRKDEKKDGLLTLDEQQAERVRNRYEEITAADLKIHELMKENMEYFEADPESEEWASYEDYIDILITAGFVNSIQNSLNLFLVNTDSRVVAYPFMEARVDLIPPEVIYSPNMMIGDPKSLQAVVEELVEEMFKQATLISRISQRREEPHYLSDMDDEEVLGEAHAVLIERVRLIMTLAWEFSSNWESYAYLWTDNRDAHLEYFLTYGVPPKKEVDEEVAPTTTPGETNPVEAEAELVPTAPTLPQFREQIDKYQTLYVELSKFKETEVLENWFLLDVRPFKQALLNTVRRWGNMFKEHLISYVKDNLTGLEEFVKEKSVNFQRVVRDGDYEALTATMTDLMELKDRQEDTDKMFEPIKQMIELLRTYDEELPEEIHVLLQELPEKWSSTKRLAQSTRTSVAALQATEVTNIRKRAAAFDTLQHEYREQFRAYDIFRFETANPYRVLDKINNELLNLENQAVELYNSSILFEVPTIEYRQLKICRKDMRLLKQLWDFITLVQNNVEQWKQTKWKDINCETMDIECKRYIKEIKLLDREIKAWDLYADLDNCVKNLTASLRAVGDLQNPAIRQRHWQQLMDATKVKVVIDEYTTLADLLKLNLHLFEEEVRNLTERSVKEMGMEKTMRDMNNTWSNLMFEFETHPRTGNTLLKLSEELTEVLEDNQVQLQMLMSSKYIAFFFDEVSGWQQKLSIADQVISVWMEVQRTWVNLESIFIGSEDIRRQLPQDSARFDNVDKKFKRLMEDLQKTPKIIVGTAKPGLVDVLEKLQGDLSLCEKALADYLEIKKLAFPRFYFVSSADLLDILSNGNLPHLVMQHLTKLFDSLAILLFKESGGKPTKIATHFQAKDGETVEMDKTIACEGQVESWLDSVLETMKSTIRNYMEIAVHTYEEKPRDVWIFDYMAQVALCGTQIWWTTEVVISLGRLEEGFENALKDYYKKQVSQLNVLINILVGEMTASDRQKIMTICTIDVHARDCVYKMIMQKIENAQSFLWQSQLRHRWDEKKKDCFANICDAQFKYSHEYLGCTPRLVVTPLTDRCYITLTQSLHLIMGAAPQGPAGTGKTETTKDLGKAIGIMVYVFNCSEQMDYKSVGDIFKGLAQTGAWGCFDEFNRISVEVLSVVAVQVKTVQDAIRDKKEYFNFLGDVIKLVQTTGAFITMNPGYAGRAELPENLKALFRPCAMVVPDFELICEIMFVAEGFIDARLLARKFMTLYSLCKELLSKQDHYDWGLRAIKSVLVVAGSLKRSDRERPEDQVLMRALRDFNVPKMVTDDMGVFLGLIGDLFPGLDVPRKRDFEMEKLIKIAAQELKLQAEDGFILKVVQLQELINVRHSVFLIGTPGAGKSEIWKTLIRFYALQKKRPTVFDLDPKAVTNDELYGIINPITREWKDGLLSVLMRDLVYLPSTGPKWIMLDGDIDPMWIESLNTVMDDNKVLTLASNERIALTPNMRMMFEIMDLKTATPATVSRAGILYINPNDLGWTPFVTSWIESRESSTERSTLMILFERWVPLMLDTLRVRFKKISPIAEIAHLHMLCYLLEIMYVPENVPMDTPKEIYELYFIYCLCWAFGSSLHAEPSIDYRVEMSKWFFTEYKSFKIPGGSIFDYFIDKESKRFVPWADKVQTFVLDPERPLQAALVHTAETTRIRYFIHQLVNIKRPVLLVGPSGSGKSVLMQQCLVELPSDQYIIANVPFNFYTTSEMLQRVLEKPLEKKAGRNYGPPGSKKIIYFIDDLNMPEVDKYFTVQPTTIVRQHIEYGHWYDRAKLSLKDIHNCQYVSCMNPTAGSFTITGRVQRHFCVFTVAFPNMEALSIIYTSILSQHLANKANRFLQSVQKMQTTVIICALALHAKVASAFLPTAIKFHYIFNLRDLSNIFQGFLFASAECLKTPSDTIRLFMHESARVYRDKMLDTADQDYFNRIQVDILKKNMEDYEETLLRQPLVYFHYAMGLGEPKYMPVNNWNVLAKMLKDVLVSYNDVNAVMNLVLFGDAIHHTIRINRILESPRGNALLVGVGGSGKQSLARLSSFISQLEVFQITLKKGYGIPDLKTDLLATCLKAGFKSIATAFLMTDAQVSEEKFLVLINDLLASGEVPDLYPDDEVENIINGMRNEVKAAGLLDTRENCWKFFISRLQRQLKVVLCFSPVGSTLRERSRKFPAVVNCTSIEWFHEWPEDALISVSMTFLSEISQLPVDARPPIAKFLAFVHISVNELSKTYLANDRRYNYTTPKSFLEQLSLYGTLLNRKYAELGVNIERLENGLAKLESTSAQVADLKNTLAIQEVELMQKNEAADQLIEVVGVETEKVSKEKAIADAEEEKVQAFTMEVAKKQQDCERDLVKAEPALKAAQEALNTLNKANLTELKSFGAPPAIVVNVLAAVMVLMAPRGKVPKDRSWKAAKLLMAKVDQFLDDLVKYDKQNIHPDIVRAVGPYLKDPDFNPDFVRGKSLAAAGLCSWAINIIRFYEIYCDVEPKRKALEEANAELIVAQEKLAIIKTKIYKLETALGKLTAQFDQATNEKLRCQREAESTQQTITLANRLVGGLQSENVRWAAAASALKTQNRALPGDVLRITAFVSYAGCFSRSYRVTLMDVMIMDFLKKNKPSIPITEGLDPLSLVTDESQIATWNNNEGLPSDRMSTENATILTQTQRWPLMIDPQLQGVKWIKQKYGKKLRVIRLGTRGYLDNIEKALSDGDVTLFENIDEAVESVLDHVLGRNTIKRGTAIKIGDKEVEYNKNFKLILHTKLANPHYKPEMQAQTTLINFTVTREGLEDQLLAQVVRKERPDLEELKADLTRQQNEFKIVLKELEDSLLFRLSSATGNILGDTTLVENLEFTKKTAAHIAFKVAEAKKTEANINETREGYRPAATRGSILYFIMNELNKISPMYQFSLKAFNVVLARAMELAEPNEDAKTRITILTDTITFSVFQYVTRSLFEKHKIIFQAQMTFQIMILAGEVSQVELDFLLRYPLTPNQLSPVDFLTHMNWGGIKSLIQIDDFRALDKDIEGAPKRWKKFVDSETPERERFPGDWKSKTPLQRMCMMRCLRPDRMTYNMMDFIADRMGPKYIEGSNIEFAKSWEECGPATPIFFILSTGVDPLKDVEALGKKIGWTFEAQNFHNVSLGQGQEPVAEAALDKAYKEGHWVILQNIHLVRKWLPILEKKVESYSVGSHPDYRVYVSAEPAPAPEYHIIPQGLLENSVKITNEPPTGIKANLHKALWNFDQETLEMSSKEAEFKSILFSLCYFHAVVAERRKFGPQGWNRSYPFNVGDLTISVSVLYNYLENNQRVPWVDLRFLFGEIMYGGHITDDWDRKLCKAYLEEYMKPEQLEGDLMLAPGFLCPPNLDYIGYHKYIDENLPAESPTLYGLHPNAEIGFLTTLSDNMFKMLLELQPKESAAAGEGALTREEKIKQVLDETLDKLPDAFNLFELAARVDERPPYVIVALQECERMNILTSEMRRSLKELNLGLKGELTITAAMDSLANALFFDVVAESWERRAYPSLMGLSSWYADLLLRVKELEQWSAEFQLPPSVWLGGLFNPQSFLTSVMQTTARRFEMPLDKMCIQVDVTRKVREDFNSSPREGAFIHGLYMEGARWDQATATINDSYMKELFALMPVIFIKAIHVDKQDLRNMYSCPVYKTRLRGPTYVWTFNLKSKERITKWVMGGVCLLLQI